MLSNRTSIDGNNGPVKGDIFVATHELKFMADRGLINTAQNCNLGLAMMRFHQHANLVSLFLGSLCSPLTLSGDKYIAAIAAHHFNKVIELYL